MNSICPLCSLISHNSLTFWMILCKLCKLNPNFNVSCVAGDYYYHIIATKKKELTTTVNYIYQKWCYSAIQPSQEVTVSVRIRCIQSRNHCVSLLLSSKVINLAHCAFLTCCSKSSQNACVSKKQRFIRRFIKEKHSCKLAVKIKLLEEKLFFSSVRTCILISLYTIKSRIFVSKQLFKFLRKCRLMTVHRNFEAA